MQLEQRRGATLCFSSHILSDVEDICDSYAVIDHGVLLEHGRLSDLLGQAPLMLTGRSPEPQGADLVYDDEVGAGSFQKISVQQPWPRYTSLVASYFTHGTTATSLGRLFCSAGRRGSQKPSAITH